MSNYVERIKKNYIYRVKGGKGTGQQEQEEKD